MLVIPALELAGGLCVRTGGGALGSADPLAAARAWASDGFSRLHVLDRDALAGSGSSSNLVESLSRDAGLEVDLSAGSDSTERIEACLDAGAARVVLGPRALAELDWLESVAGAFPDTLIVETSVRERRVVTRGWVRTLPVDLLDLVDELAGLRLAGLMISAFDGGSEDRLELALLEDVADACEFSVLVADGRPTIGSLRALEHRGLSAVVVPGSALATALDPHAVAGEFGR
jgi:phosphoribosylformimino-5-aminoimidazole carboxamide ribotide isomerase